MNNHNQMKVMKIFLFVLMVPVITIAQEKRTAIGITAGPSFYTLAAETGFAHEYTSKSSFRAGIDLLFFLSRKSELRTGISYSNVGYKVDYNYVFTIPGDPQIPRSGDITAGYLEIPIAYNFNCISNEKLVMYLSTGIISSILISSDDKTTFEDNSIRSSGYLNSFLLSFQVAAGIRYNLNDLLGIKFEPQYQLFMKGIDKFMNQSPTAINLMIGMVYNLKS
jgi:hypothetical protein